jgi:ribosomal-protein-alanine N-acetyltransferase
MLIVTTHCVIRSLREDDAESFAEHANNRNIWINLRDFFPHPYSVQDAHTFIRLASSHNPECEFAIDIRGKAVGAIGFVVGKDVERISAEIGYWLGEAYWGRGVTTEALRATTAWIIREHGLYRVFAKPYARNKASCRVLEKAGYQLEGRIRSGSIKDGQIEDQMLYAYVADRFDDADETNSTSEYAVVPEE